MTGVTPTAYYEATMRLLAVGGPASVTIASLGQALDVSSGSFYHHFGSFDGFVGDFLERWEAEATERIIAATRSQGDAAQRWSLLVELAAQLPHRAEAAIRAWAHSNDQVASAQKRVDNERFSYVEEVVLALTSDPIATATLTAVAMSAFVGAQQLHHRLGDDGIAEVMRQVEMAVRERA